MRRRHSRSALRASALRRAVIVAAPILVLWLFVAFALEPFA